VARASANGAYMAARRRDRAEAEGFRLLIWQGGGEVEVMGYDNPADALAAAVDYLKAGYHCRLADEAVEHYRAEPAAPAAWFPNARDWRLLLGMLQRAAEQPGFFHAAAEARGRYEADRLAARIAGVVRRVTGSGPSALPGVSAGRSCRGVLVLSPGPYRPAFLPGGRGNARSRGTATGRGRRARGRPFRGRDR
jgi:hypothetical protein